MKRLWSSFILSLVPLLFFLSFSQNAFAYTSGPVRLYSLQAIQSTSTSVTVSWFDDGGVHRYDLVYGTDPNHYSFGVVNVPYIKNAGNSFTVGALAPGTTYYFSLMGYESGNGNPFFSGPVMASFQTNNAASSLNLGNALTNPYSFAVLSENKKGSVTVSWYDDSSAYRYDLVYGNNPTNNAFGVLNLPFIQNANDTFDVGGLQSGTTYYFTLLGYTHGNGNPYYSGPFAIQAP